MVNGVASIPLMGPVLGSDLGPSAGPSRPFVMRHFVAGPENRFTALAIDCVLNQSHSHFHPLVFCGPSGVGKTHVARGLARRWNELGGRGQAIYTTATQYARQLKAVIQSNKVAQFRDRHRNASLLVVEDLGDLTNMRAMQRELLSTLDAVGRTGGRVIITSRLPPLGYPKLLTSLRSRLSSGLVLALSPPSAPARLELIHTIAIQRKLNLPEGAGSLLADAITGTVPEILVTILEFEASLNQYIQPNRLGQPSSFCATKTHPATHTPSIDATRRYLALRASQRKPEMQQILAATAKHFSLKQSHIKGHCRSRTLVLARGIAMYLARTMTGQTLQQVGCVFSGRDHTTVLHNCRKIERLLRTDLSIRLSVDRLQQTLMQNLEKLKKA